MLGKWKTKSVIKIIDKNIGKQVREYSRIDVIHCQYLWFCMEEKIRIGKVADVKRQVALQFRAIVNNRIKIK